MKLALLASLLTFAGSLAGFGLASATGPATPVVAGPPAASEQVVVGPAADDAARDRDCPKPDGDRA